MNYELILYLWHTPKVGCISTIKIKKCFFILYCIRFALPLQAVIVHTTRVRRKTIIAFMLLVAMFVAAGIPRMTAPETSTPPPSSPEGDTIGPRTG